MIDEVVIHNTLKALGDTTSMLEKKKILVEFSDGRYTDDTVRLLKKIFKMVHDPDYIFGIKDRSVFDTAPSTSHSTVELEKALFFIEDKFIKNKIRGGDQKRLIQELMLNLSETNSDLIMNIILKKLNIDTGRHIINDAMPGTVMLPQYMGAVPYSEERLKKIFDVKTKMNHSFVVSQEKMDGMYANFNTGPLSFISRNMKPIQLNIGSLNSRIEPFLKKLRDSFMIESTSDTRTGDFVLNGELLIRGFDRYTSNGLLNSISTTEAKLDGSRSLTEKELKKIDKTKIEIETEYNTTYDSIIDSIYFVVWDFIPQEHFNNGLWDIPYSTRLSILEGAISTSDNQENNFISLVQTKKITVQEEALEHYYSVVQNGGEGTIVKSIDTIWKSGKPNSQLKLKLEMDVEMEIIGFRQGDSGTKYHNTLGAFIVKSKDDKIITKAPGLTEKMRFHAWDNKKDYLNKIITVKCNGYSKNRDGGHSLLHPRFDEMRPDKTEANTLEEILEIQTGIIKKNAQNVQNTENVENE